MKIFVICAIFVVWTSSVQSASWDFSVLKPAISGLQLKKKLLISSCPNYDIRQLVLTSFSTSSQTKDVIEEPSNPNPKRVQCSSDGNALSLTINRDLDNDGVRPEKIDRQRLELKTADPKYGGPAAALGSTFVYAWWFKLNSNIKPSSLASDFFHIFQIKIMEENTNPPVTLSLHSSGYLRLQVNEDQRIKLVPISEIAGVWTEIVVKVYYHDSDGYVDVTLKNSKLSTPIKQRTGLWVPDTSFRSKWGLYRSRNSNYNKEDTLLLQNIQIYGKP